MLVRKLRIERGWSQETLAEVSGLSVRTIQRIERGGNASLESLNALAAVFEIDVADLSMETRMYKQNELPEKEQEAVEYARDIKGFYSHLIAYLVTVPALAATNFYMGIENPWFIWPTLGWGLGVALHGLTAFEKLSLFGVDWERRQIKKWMQRYSD